MKKNLIGFIMIASLVGGCTSAERGKFFALGDSAKVVCYSGGFKIYDGYSTGKVLSETSSDGYYFVDRDTKNTLEVSGNCVITYGRE